MKKILFAMLIFSLYFSTSFAFISTTPTQKEYHFKYQAQNRTLEYTEKSMSFEEALEKVAMKCFKDLRGSSPLSEDRGLELIDICANPRNI